jgi:light-regulated signal transduction histidine kinase (bacteriophytochrome)
MHSLLRRQLQKHTPFSPDAPPAELTLFLEAVSQAYEQHETDYRMIERTLELSSAELNARTKTIEEQKLELQRSNTELEHFAYIASHDLQEPLRTIQSYLQLLQRRYQPLLDQDAEEFIAFAIDGASRMRMLIEDLLTYARVASRARPFEAVHLDEVLNEVMQSLKVRLEEKSAVVERGPLPVVMADRRQLAQLIQNLFSNALKFQQPDKTPIIQIGASPDNENWIVSVRDNGIGLSTEYQDKIFVIFQRLHSREDYEGTGVGLAVCKKIIDRHGGSIWVESKPSEGATFRFTLMDAATSKGTSAEMEQCHD